MKLSDREYWTTSEASQVMGRSPSYWARMYDSGCIRGYKDRGRHLKADSCRDHLDRLCGTEPAEDIDARLKAEKLELKFWNRQRERMVG